MKLKVSIRTKLVEEGQQVLADRSFVFHFAGSNVRRDFADAYIEWRLTGGGDDKRAFGLFCIHDYGINPALVWLLVSIAFEVLKYWWSHRT